MSSTSQKDREFLIKFIRYYKQLPALWNAKCQEYRDPSLKNKSYHLLLKKYKDNYPTATLGDVKKKINSLRSNYRRYYQKYGPDGPPSLYWFKEMFFIMGSEDVDSEIDVEASYLEVKCDPLDTDMSVNDSLEKEAEEIEHYEIIESNIVKYEKSEQPLLYENETPRKKSSSALIYENKTPQKPTVPLIYKKEIKTPAVIYKKEKKPNKIPAQNKKRRESITLVHVEDEYDYWGKVMAAELKKMDPLQQVFAKKAITDVLLEGQLGLLTKNSVQINKATDAQGSKT